MVSGDNSGLNAPSLGRSHANAVTETVEAASQDTVTRHGSENSLASTTSNRRDSEEEESRSTRLQNPMTRFPPRLTDHGFQFWNERSITFGCEIDRYHFTITLVSRASNSVTCWQLKLTENLRGQWVHVDGDLPMFVPAKDSARLSSMSFDVDGRTRTVSYSTGSRTRTIKSWSSAWDVLSVAKMEELFRLTYQAVRATNGQTSGAAVGPLRPAACFGYSLKTFGQEYLQGPDVDQQDYVRERGRNRGLYRIVADPLDWINRKRSQSKLHKDTTKLIRSALTNFAVTVQDLQGSSS